MPVNSLIVIIVRLGCCKDVKIGLWPLWVGLRAWQLC